MTVTLQHHTPLVVCSDAIRTCWQSQDKSDNGGEKDRALIDRVGNKFKHASTLEHLVYTFEIDGISRACLQELARHRMASMSVKSTRYTLKELKEENSCFLLFGHEGHKVDEAKASKYVVLTGDKLIDQLIVASLNSLRLALKTGISNDIAKYCLPEAYKTTLTWTINARSLQNFLSLRSDKSALWEMQDLARAVYAALPDDHRYLFEECVKC